MPKRNKLWANIDWITVFLFLLFMFLGWLNIYASIYNESQQGIFDFSQRYGKQLIWIGAAILIALIILVIETSFYVFFSYAIYGISILLLILVLIFGTEINGARSWFTFGNFGFQPSEFCKLATALALARYMSSFGFKLLRFKSVVTILTMIFIPVFFILLQNDTGSALVYFSFVLVLYREGLSGVVLFFILLATILFISALIVSDIILIVVLLVVAMLAFYMVNQKMKQFSIVLAVYGFSLLLFFILKTFQVFVLQLEHIFIAGSIVGTLAILIFSFRKRLKSYTLVALIFLGSVLFTISVDYTFDNLLGAHHRSRLNEYLGIVSDPLGAGYNLNQSKIAIGSGGLLGKGFLNGTQTKFDFVPAQTTDFIFCTIGEEWGFVGTFIFIVLFLFFVIRIIWLAERQRSGFSRIYGYSVAIILFFHFAANVGMTIGLMPVIGIPLPFFSYGGSSLWSFTVLLFIFIRLDASRLEHLSE